MGSIEHNRDPINSTAAMMLCKGEQYTSKKKGNGGDSELPIPIRALPWNADKTLIGKRRGKLTVLGISFKKYRWVVRCDCGMYSLRKSKSMNNENNIMDRCDTCRELLYLKRKEHYNRTGFDKPLEFFV